MSRSAKRLGYNKFRFLSEDGYKCCRYSQGNHNGIQGITGLSICSRKNERKAERYICKRKSEGKMKRHFLSLICTVIISLVLSGCGAGSRLDGSGNASITSDWYLVEFTVNGTTTKPSDDPFLVRLFTAGMNPKFKCKDGENCTFSYGKKSRAGTVAEDSGEYTIMFDDTTKSLKGVISGNILTITDEKEKLRFVFETND